MKNNVLYSAGLTFLIYFFISIVLTGTLIFIGMSYEPQVTVLLTLIAGVWLGKMTYTAYDFDDVSLGSTIGIGLWKFIFVLLYPFLSGFGLQLQEYIFEFLLSFSTFNIGLAFYYITKDTTKGKKITLDMVWKIILLFIIFIVVGQVSGLFAYIA